MRSPMRRHRASGPNSNKGLMTFPENELYCPVAEMGRKTERRKEPASIECLQHAGRTDCS